MCLLMLKTVLYVNICITYVYTDIPTTSFILKNYIVETLWYSRLAHGLPIFSLNLIEMTAQRYPKEINHENNFEKSNEK